MDDNKKIVFALDIGTRSVVGVVGALKDGKFNVLDYEQEFHEKRAMRDGQIEDIDLVSRVVGSIKSKLEQRTGQTFTKVSIAAAGRALKTVSAEFTYDLIPNESITEKIVQYMEYSAIEKAQETFVNSDSAGDEYGVKDYYCVGYSVTEYLLDGYKIKSLVGQKGTSAVANIIAAFLPSTVLISLYAVTAKCGLEVDNLTLEPIAAIHAVVPDDVRFLNIALIDIGGGTSDIAISRDGSVIAYDMVTIAGDEITEAIMQNYLTNFATAERIKLAMNGSESIEFKDILGNQITVTPDEAFKAVKGSIDALADGISQRILLINGNAPAAVFLVGGGSQIRDLCKIVAKKLGMAENRVAIGVANTETNLSLFSEELYNPAFVTPVGIGIVSSLYRGCDFFAISVNGKRLMLFNHQTIKVIDALMLSGIKPSGLIGLTAPNLTYTLNGQRRIVKGSPGIPGELYVNGLPSTIEAEIKQGDEITVTLAKNGLPPCVTVADILKEFDLSQAARVEINGTPVAFKTAEDFSKHKINYMDEVHVISITGQMLAPVVAAPPLAPLSPMAAEKISEAPNSSEPVEPTAISKLVLNSEPALDSEPSKSAADKGASEPSKSAVNEENSESLKSAADEGNSAPLKSVNEEKAAEPVTAVEINKIYSNREASSGISLDPAKVSLLLADETSEPDIPNALDNPETAGNSVAADSSQTVDNPIKADSSQTAEKPESPVSSETTGNPEAPDSEAAGSPETSDNKTEKSGLNLTVTLNDNKITLIQETEEPLILMHLLKYVDLDILNPRGTLILKINNQDAKYADPLHDSDIVEIRWSEA